MGGGDQSPDERLSLRLATMEDLDDIVKVVIEGRFDDPEIPYRMANYKKYPEEYREWIRHEWEKYLSQPTKYAVAIVTASDFNNKPVSLSIWDITIEEVDEGGDLGVPDEPTGEVRRKDVEPKLYRAWKEQITTGFMKYIYDVFGIKQKFLWVLCTLPEFRGRGATTMAINWGLEHAAKAGVPSTVMVVDPKLLPFYENLGWKYLGDGKFTIRIGDEPESMDVWPMSHDP